MNTAFSPIANRHNPKAAYTKIHEWVLRFGSPTLLSSSCENPILLNYQTLAQSNCWVTISYNRLLLTADLRNHPDRFDMSRWPSLP